MTIDELIEQLRKFKYDGISGETPVIVDCYDIPDGYRSIAGLEAASRKSFDAGSGYGENLSREDIMRLYDELRQKLRKAQQRALDELDELEGAS